MGKRLLNCYASDFIKMDRKTLKAAIKASEGRTILSENIVSTSASPGLTNSEIARSVGADLVLLNGLDLQNPKVNGLDLDEPDPVSRLKKLTGRPIGVNIEPVDPDAKMSEDKLTISRGRQAFKETFEKAEEMGFDFICLTGNPGTGVSNKEISKAISAAKVAFSGLIIAGKMHGAGVNEAVVDLDAVRSFIKSGADIILLPAIGTVPGVTPDMIYEAVRLCRQSDALSMSAIGTSQETADPTTIKDIALQNKIAGVDIQHIGDAGYGGIAPYLNILEMSRVIRGDRHTLARMAGSNAR